MIPTRSRTARKDAVSTEEAVSLKHLKTSRSMTSLSLWGSAQNEVQAACSDRHVAPCTIVEEVHSKRLTTRSPRPTHHNILESSSQ